MDGWLRKLRRFWIRLRRISYAFKFIFADILLKTRQKRHFWFLNPRRRKHILIACMPKSGSTFLATAMMEVTGYSSFFLAYEAERNEQDLYLPNVVRAMDFHTVTQQHLRATKSNLEIMSAFSIRPVVLVRNLLDIVVSIHDHLDRGLFAGPSAYFNEEFRKRDGEDRIDQIIDLAIPWYIYFYVSWCMAERNNLCDPLWLRYEDVLDDRIAAIGKVLTFYDLQKSDEEIRSALDRASSRDTRLNKGISGRGMAMLSEEQKQRIVRLTRYYPEVDFSRIGIPRDEPAF